MPNETRPRRESSGTSRIRKSSTPASSPAPDETQASPAAGSPPFAGAGDSAPPPIEPGYRDRGRESYREEGPADREPIRFVRERSERDRAEREPVRERPEREPGLSIRER